MVYCSISGFGSGAGAAIPGYDLLVQAVGGLMSVTGEAAGEPVKAGVALVDVITGLHASLGIMAALRHRDATGQGQHVEVNLLSSLLSALVNQASAFAVAGVVPGRMGNAHPSIAPYETFRAADRPIAVAVGNDRQFAALADLVGDPGLARDDRFRTNTDRVAHRAELRDILTARLGAAGADHWSALLLAAGVPAGPVNTVEEAFDFARKLGLPGIVDIPADPADPADPARARPARQVANPITLSATPVRYDRPPPRLGQHTAEILPCSAPRTTEPDTTEPDTTEAHPTHANTMNKTNHRSPR